MTQFQDPSAGGDSLKPADVLGHLLIVRPLEHVASIPTSFGDKDAIRCDVADLDANEIHRDVLWFPGLLIGGLKNSIGGVVLAVMSQGTAKPGQSAPWMLEGKAGDPASTTRAEQWLATNSAAWFGLSDPTPAASAPAAAVVI